MGGRAIGAGGGGPHMAAAGRGRRTYHPGPLTLMVRLRSEREVLVSEPSCPTLTVKFTMLGDFYCIYDNHLNYLFFLFEVLIEGRAVINTAY
jgi:hypothetical protein